VGIKIRNVISRYFEDEQDSLDPTIDNVDFVEYLKKKNDTPVFDTNKGDATYNPYDYNDPSSKGKDMGDSEVMYKDTPSYPTFGNKKVFDSEEPLGYWRKDRRKDETVPPEEQAPAMSLDRRYARSKAAKVIEQFKLRFAWPDIKLKNSPFPIDLGFEKLDKASVQSILDDLKAGKRVKTLNIPDHYVHNDHKDFKLEDLDSISLGFLNKYFDAVSKGKFVSNPHPEIKYEKGDYTKIPIEPLKTKELIKIASIRNVVAEYLLQHMPIVAVLSDINETPSISKVAATLNEIVAKHRHYKLTLDYLRSKRVSVNWKKFNSTQGVKKGFVNFKATSDSGETHSVFFQFMKDDDKDIISTDQAKSYADLPVSMSCSCESFLFYGAQWYALQGMYMYMPALRRSILPPVTQNRISRLESGKGLNFRVCKHILACYEEIKKWPVQTEFKRMIKYTPLSRIINPQQWKQSFGMEFSYKAIMGFLKKPKPLPRAISNFFKYKKETADQKEALGALNDYFQDRWIRKSTTEKIQVLKAYVNHPEEIFYFLMREAYSKSGNINDRLAKEGIILISKAIDPNYARVLLKGDLEAVPGKVPIEKSVAKGAVPGKEKGMPLIKPGEDEGEGEEEEKPGSKRFETKKPSSGDRFGPKPVKPAIKPLKSEEV